MENILVSIIGALAITLLIMFVVYSHNIAKLKKSLDDVYTTNTALRKANSKLKERNEDLYEELKSTHDEYKQKLDELGRLAVHKEQ